MKKKCISLLLVLTMLCGILAGCSKESSTGNNDEKADSEGRKIAVLIANANMPFCQDMVTGVKEVVKEGDEVLEYSYDEDPTKQAETINDLIVKKVDLIITNILDADSVVSPLRQCKEAGIPVVLLDGQLAKENDDLCYATVENDVYNVGYMHGKSLCESIGGKGELAYIFWAAASDTAKLRVQGFKDAVAEYPDVKLVSEAESAFDTDSALEQINAILQLYPELDGFWATWAASGLAAVSAIGNAGMQDTCKLAVSDFDTDFANYLKDGKIYSCVYLNTVNMGKLAMEAGYKAMNGEELEEKHIINSEQSEVKADQADEFLEKLK